MDMIYGYDMDIYILYCQSHDVCTCALGTNLFKLVANLKELNIFNSGYVGITHLMFYTMSHMCLPALPRLPFSCQCNLLKNVKITKYVHAQCYQEERKYRIEGIINGS
jgi:hypothetical protein